MSYVKAKLEAWRSSLEESVKTEEDKDEQRLEKMSFSKEENSFRRTTAFYI